MNILLRFALLSLDLALALVFFMLRGCLDYLIPVDGVFWGHGVQEVSHIPRLLTLRCLTVTEDAQTLGRVAIGVSDCVAFCGSHGCLAFMEL